MSNTNGLLECKSVCGTGAVDSAFYVRKGELIPAPVVSSPLSIKSASGSQTSTIAVNNAGLTTITGGNEIDLVPGVDDSVVIQYSNSAATSGGLALINESAPTQEGRVFADVTGSLELSSSTGVVNLLADNGLKVKPQNQTTGAGTITLQNGTSAAAPTYYTMYNTSVTGGGVTAGQLDIFGYSGTNYTTIRRVFAANPTGTAITLGDAAGCAVIATGSLSTPKLVIPSSSPYSGAVSLTGTSVTVGIPAGLTSDSQILITPTSGPIGRLFATYVNSTSFTINSTNAESPLTVMYLVITPV